MLKRFFNYYRPYKGLFILDFSSAVIAAVLELAFPVAVNSVIDTILPSGNWNRIITASIFLLLLYIVNTFLQFVVIYFGHRLGINIETDMRQDLFNKLQKQSFSYYDNNKTGKLMTRLTADLQDISEVAHHGPEDIFITLITLVGAFLLMLRVHTTLAIATIVLIPFIMFAVSFFNKKMTAVNTRIFENLGEFNAGIEATVSGVRVVQAFANEAHESERFKGLNKLYRQARLTFYKTMGISSSYNYLMIRLINLFALFFGSYFTLQGELSYGDFVGFILLSNIFVRPIEKVNNMIEQYPKGIAGFKRFIEEMDRELEITDKPGAVDVTHLDGNIVYDAVSFSYDNATPVLESVNLSIKAGETVAFVGPSGGGKTTICNLLPRFYEATEGTISIDGMAIKDMTMHSLRNQIGVVQQDVYLFPGTIRENIRYGKLDATEEEIKQAAIMANLEHVIRSMPEGLDTIIGERGVKLSGGQKQRLSIARMFLKNPPILILDEATSALDTETEQVIQESLDSLAEGRTTLIIAHRLATIKHATRIVVVSDHGIAEQGTHEELITQDGVYRRLYEAQFLA